MSASPSTISFSQSAHLDNLLGRLHGVREVANSAAASGRGYQAVCPGHDDRLPSLSIALAASGAILLKCQAGCSLESIIGAMGMSKRDLFPTSNGTVNGTHKEIVAEYDYTDEAGNLLYQCVRFTPKTFRQRRPDGQGGWVWNLKDVRLVVFHLPQLLASDPASPVLIVEGEKDVLNLESLGFVATCNPMGAGKWRDQYNMHLSGRHVVIIADKDGPGRDHAHKVAISSHDKAASVRILELPGNHVKDASDWISAGGTAGQLREIIEAAPLFDPATVPPAVEVAPSDDGKAILIGTDEYRVIDQTLARLAGDPDLFQRAGVLCHVVTGTSDKRITRDQTSPIIRIMPQPRLRKEISRIAPFVKETSDGGKKRAHPPAWLVSAIFEHGEYEHIRNLNAICDHPILRADGTIAQEPGYDASTGALFVPSTTFPTIGDGINLDDASAAADEILDTVCDFPFEAPEHRAAFLAAVLTPVGRHAFSGPSPLFLFDANVRGSGKTLMAQIPAEIATGRPAAVVGYSSDPNEMRKLITASAIAGDRIILLDNIADTLGNEALDRALTATHWRDRILGRSEMVEMPLYATWLATANNCAIHGDTARRVIHVRLDAMYEHPEERDGFKYVDLIGHVRKHRARLLTSALTILAAYIRSGRLKDMALTPFGSFEGWSGLVRQAVVWVGQPDPCLTRKGLAIASDTASEILDGLIDAWSAFDPFNNGLVIVELLRQLYGSAPPDPTIDGLKAAVESMVGTPPGKMPTARQIGVKLRSFRRRVIGNRFLDVDPGKYHRMGAVWRLFDATV